MTVPAQRHYATRLRALSYGECTRMTGDGFAGTLVWLITRFKGAEGRMLLPQLQAHVRAERAELDPVATARLELFERQLHGFGYRVLLFQRLRTPASPTQVANGGFVAASADGQRFAFVNFIRQQKPTDNEPTDTLALSFVSFRRIGGAFSATNFSKGLDPRPDCVVEYVDTTDLATLEHHLRQLTARDEAGLLKAETADELAATLDREDLATFRDRVERRRLFVPVD